MSNNKYIFTTNTFTVQLMSGAGEVTIENHFIDGQLQRSKMRSNHGDAIRVARLFDPVTGEPTNRPGGWHYITGGEIGAAHAAFLEVIFVDALIAHNHNQSQVDNSAS